MRQSKKLFIFVSILFMMNTSVFAGKIDSNLYTEVKNDTNTIASVNNESALLQTTYSLKHMEDDGDEVYDYYLLEARSYFTQDGNRLTHTHVTNNAAIIFESSNYTITRLMGKENKFVTFFSGLNNLTKASCINLEDNENDFQFSRQVYAGKRYFDNTYVFTTQTAFRVLENKEVQIELTIDGGFVNEPLTPYSVVIDYDPLND